MTYQEFLSDVTTQLAPRLSGGTTLQIQKINKNNGLCYDGLIISTPGRNIAPTIYLRPYYHRYLDGASLEEIYSDILCTYERHLPRENFDTTAFMDFSKIRNRLTMRLVNYEKNRDLLTQIPHIPYLDLAVVFSCLLEANYDEQASILIYNRHLEHWRTSVEELYALSLKNTPRLLPFQLDDMKDLLSLFLESTAVEPPEEELPFPMYVLSNHYRSHGAAAILYPRLLAEIADSFGKDLILLPSSIHEVILIPFTEEPDYEALRNMVQEVNETQVSDEEILSDRVYLFSRKEGALTAPGGLEYIS